MEQQTKKVEALVHTGQLTEVLSEDVLSEDGNVMATVFTGALIPYPTSTFVFGITDGERIDSSIIPASGFSVGDERIQNIIEQYTESLENGAVHGCIRTSRPTKEKNMVMFTSNVGNIVLTVATDDQLITGKFILKLDGLPSWLVTDEFAVRMHGLIQYLSYSNITNQTVLPHSIIR